MKIPFSYKWQSNMTQVLQFKKLEKNFDYYVQELTSLCQNDFSSINSVISWSLAINFAFCISSIDSKDNANLNCSVAS